jgi:hypothetical protein
VSIRSERRFLFDADRTTVWDAVVRTDQYRVWWPWLHGFDGTKFEEGSRWQCAVKPPLPYVLRFELALIGVIDQDTVVVAVTGDLTGHGLLQLTDHHQGTELLLSYDLNPAKRTLQAVVKVARPAVVIALDWVLDTGARQFGHAALHE